MNIVLHWGYIQVHMEGDKCTLGFWIQGTPNVLCQSSFFQTPKIGIIDIFV